jgi:hypothetical protein
MGQTHPWTVMRANAFLAWIDSGDYEKVLRAPQGAVAAGATRSCARCGTPLAGGERFCPRCGASQLPAVSGVVR